MALILVIILTHNKLAILIKQTQYSIKIPFWTRFISQFINFYLQLTFRNLVTLFNLHSKNVPGNVQFSRFWGSRALRFGIIKVYNTVQHRWFRYDVLLLKPLLKHHIFFSILRPNLWNTPKNQYTLITIYVNPSIDCNQNCQQINSNV